MRSRSYARKTHSPIAMMIAHLLSQVKQAAKQHFEARKPAIPAVFLRHYPAHKNGKQNISELARVCDISRTTAYKYKAVLEG